MASVALSPAARTQALENMAREELDVLVIGGGVVGSGAALDAVTRGLRVGLIEAQDFAAGTSSRSSKLIHGGLRYLGMLDFRLVAEALRERGLLIQKLAPHLIRPVPFIYPLKHRVWERFYADSGVALYDTLGMLTGQSRGVPRHRHLTRRGARAIAPSLREDALVGALQYYDAQVDDARHTLFVARTAAAYGAHVANRARVVGFLKEAGRVIGAEVSDMETGERIRIRAKRVVNATGVWTEETLGLSGERGGRRVRASKGIHLVVPRDRIRSDSGLILRTEKSVLFVIPWGRQWIIGTTDTDWELGKDHPVASKADIGYLLDRVNAVLEDPLTHEDIQSVYAGLRPLLASGPGPTAKLSREHAVESPVPGLVVITGGKYTTYRVMAKDAIDAAVTGLGRKVPPSCTKDVPLLGAEGWRALQNSVPSLAEQSGLSPTRVESLLGRYGSLVHEILDLIRQDRSLGEPLTSAPAHLRAEIVYAASHEGARHLDDVLTRRTRIGIETSDRGLDVAEEAASLIGPLLGWSAEQRASEVEAYRGRIAAERESQTMPDDVTAHAVQLGALPLAVQSSN